MTVAKGVAFVVMGYHKKMDFATGRALDMDLTHDLIIKPAAADAELHCIRNDEVRLSGHVERDMYLLLAKADVVIVDISTANPNAIYELGVRHALRRRTTIVLVDTGMNLPWNLSHFRVIPYTHGGDHIAKAEVARVKERLATWMKEALAHPKDDSPVYQFLNELTPPIPENAVDEALDIRSSLPIPVRPGVTLRQTVERALRHLKADEFAEARKQFMKAHRADPHDPFVLQQLVHCTYKLEQPDLATALEDAWQLLQKLHPDETTDTETLGLAAAICKRQYFLHNVELYLTEAIELLERGFGIRPNSYNGVNLAFLYNVRASISQDTKERAGNTWRATDIRRMVLEIAEKERKNASREQLYWIWANIAEAYVGLSNEIEAHRALKKAHSLQPPAWQEKTTKEQIGRLRQLLAESSGD